MISKPILVSLGWVFLFIQIQPTFNLKTTQDNPMVYLNNPNNPSGY